VQRWVDWESAGRAPGDGLLDVFEGTGVPDGWLAVVRGEDGRGNPVTVAHRDSDDLASLAVLDLVLNNADRKGAHLLTDASGRLWAVDHGLTLHTEEKLRTVLWGWGGERIPTADQERLERLLAHLDDGAETVTELISSAEVGALRRRVETLLHEPVFPHPPNDRYGLPWPLW